MKPTTDKFKTNKHAKQMKADNVARKLGTEESVEQIKEWERFVEQEINTLEKKVKHSNKDFLCGIILGFALGILFFHVFLVMPILATYN